VSNLPNRPSHIVWVTRHHYDVAQSWLKQQAPANIGTPVCIQREVNLVDSVDCAIVATSPSSHADIARLSLSLGIPTLCEKPLARTLSEMKGLASLASRRRVPFGIHLEFRQAEFLQVVAKHFARTRPESLRIEWFDPWIEVRGEIVKRPEVRTDIVSDQLPHCWSVLNTLLPTFDSPKNCVIEYAPELTTVRGRYAKMEVECRMSRRHAKRLRRISSNGGRFAFDFSSEPGVLTIDGADIQLPGASVRPLQQSLGRFLDIVRHPNTEPGWEMSVFQCQPAIEWAFEVADQLRLAQDKILGSLRKHSQLDVNNPQHVEMIIDRWFPEHSPKDATEITHTPQQQKEFAQAWCSSFDI